jgi:hypothetical protein
VLEYLQYIFFIQHGFKNSIPSLELVGVEPDLPVTAEEATAILIEAVSNMVPNISTRRHMMNSRRPAPSPTPMKISETPLRYNTNGARKTREILLSLFPKGIEMKRIYLHPPSDFMPKDILAFCSNDQNYLPLAGIKVIDFSQAITAPTICRTLAFLGADVVRVGYSGNPDSEPLLLDLSCGKRGCDLDLRSKKGDKIFAKFLKDADVIVNGYRLGVLEILEFGDEKIEKSKSGICDCESC